MDVVKCSDDFIPNITKHAHIEKQIEVFLNAFSNQLKRPYSSMTNFVIQTILQSNMEVNIKYLEQKTGYCSRHIQRVFKQDVGINIKAFSCIMRFQSAIHALTDQSCSKLSDLTYDLGYNDQAHFHKEFKKFINMSPSSFVKYLHHYS
ncbi:helix-turn-helix domain-containing protein [Acinetobacter sp. MD2(2019)]|uniref:helix-turn-helix domain-containing protein n=1 Tax=Acinetobacter sp. MD2(2019) TaxID=2605273 RepID=UPI002D1EB901|nr:helix-turn-helix domain-containing protein [Acinetobacter sp. MD2(2019)]MEB3755007.1 AraC family transcriptional regulator [Acinetobacter sp. MD2(2019)]